MEGALAGVRSIALSQAYSREGMGDTVPFAAAEGWAERVLAPLLTFDTPPGALINVNFPSIPADEVKGVRVCRQGIRDYGRLRIVQRTDPRGYDYYWFGLGPMVETPGHLTDLEAVADGFVSITPLHLASAYAALVNGGVFRPATLMRVQPGSRVPGRQVYSEATSYQIRQLLRLNVLHGTGRRAEQRDPQGQQPYGEKDGHGKSQGHLEAAARLES